jgi:mitogen-activated protein kinase 1/3
MVYEEILLYHFPDFKKDYYKKIRMGQSIIKHII